jgi:DNA-binding NarL/FixJ family response regulator
VEKLTPRQRQIVRLQSQGLCHKEIASELHISLSTLKTHLTRALARNRSNSSLHLHNQIRAREIAAIAGKIRRLLTASDRDVALQRSWPPFS